MQKRKIGYTRSGHRTEGRDAGAGGHKHRRSGGGFVGKITVRTMNGKGRANFSGTQKSRNFAAVHVADTEVKVRLLWR